MKIKMILQQTDLVSGNTEIKDISDLVYDIVYESQIMGQPGKLTFGCVDDQATYFNEGAVIKFFVNDVGVFWGYVFTSKFNESDYITVTAYDQLRYFQNQDIYVVSGKTASQMFEIICRDFQVPRWKTVSSSSLILPSYVHDNKTLFEIINYGIGQELIENKKWYIIRDSFGTVEFIDIAKLRTDFLYSAEDNIFNYSFESSIDEDSYNQIKIYQENRENKKGKAVKSGGTVVGRDWAVADNPSTKKHWGILQYCEVSSEHRNDAQLAQYAKSILSQKNRPTQKFNMTAEGNLSIKSGNQIVININKVKQKIVDRNYFLVEACTHRFNNNEHKMELLLGLPQYGLDFK